MTTRQLALEERKIVRQAFRICTFPWPEEFERPRVEAESRSGFGYYDYLRNVIVVNDLVIRSAASGSVVRKRQAKSTVLHETFHGICYQLLNNAGRRSLTTVLHDGVEHVDAPPDSGHPWGADARDEEKWTDHGHAWWDSRYEESMMEASADAFLQAFSPFTSQTAGRWVHKITPDLELRFRDALLAIV